MGLFTQKFRIHEYIVDGKRRFLVQSRMYGFLWTSVRYHLEVDWFDTHEDAERFLNSMCSTMKKYVIIR